MLASEALQHDAALIDQALPRYLPVAPAQAGQLDQAIRYSVQGGKRLRGALVMRAAATFGLRPETVLPTACAFEMLHAATLIHDDLPSIDNSDMRRGQPSCHCAFGEFTALLAGDALIIGAFAALAAQADTLPADRVVSAIAHLAHAAGASGLIGGEQADILGERLPPDPDLLYHIHLNKTARLIQAACHCGLLLAAAPQRYLPIMDSYGLALGLLFQITDDILDVVGDQDALGKPTGADQAAGKQTWPQVHSLQDARDEARRLAAQAVSYAQRLPAQRDFWVSLPELVVARDR